MSLSKVKIIYNGVIIILLVVFVSLTAGCGAITSAEKTQMASWTDTPTIDPTCAPFLISTLKPLVHQPMLLVVLYQTEKPYTNLALQIIYDVIPTIISPGDYIQIFIIGQRTYENAEVIAGRVGYKIERPDIPATPEVPVDYTPAPTITRSNIVLGGAQGENEYNATQTAAVAAVTQQYQKYVCLQAVFTQSYGDVSSKWAVTQEAMMSNYRTSLQEAVQAYIVRAGNRPEPEESMLFYSLSQATITFDAECIKYGRCILLILSDLHEWRTEEVENSLYIKLNNVEVLAPILDCVNINRPECSYHKTFWEPHFRSNGVISTDYTDRNDVESWLLERIGR